MVIAAGAIERPLVFPGNDRPGVMLADAARIYLHRYGVKVGARAVITTSDDTAYAAGVALREAGVVIGAVADVRGDISDVARSVRLAGTKRRRAWLPLADDSVSIAPSCPMATLSLAIWC